MTVFKPLILIVLSYITILITCTVIVNQIRRNKEEITRHKIEDLRPECHPIISSMGNGLMIEYPCTGEVKDL
jgi:hypothetical protein